VYDDDGYDLNELLYEVECQIEALEAERIEREEVLYRRFDPATLDQFPSLCISCKHAPFEV